jgi:hypothetical protein
VKYEVTTNAGSLYWTYITVRETIGDCGDIWREVISGPVTEIRPA